jgi:Ca-activated chloride channel family protein
MRALDLEVRGRRLSRLQAALRFAGQFVERREGDRIGVVAFGGRAITQCPLTFDRRVARTLLGHLEPDMLGKRTAIGDGIALAVARLRRGGALLLLTDGENTAGRVEPMEAALAATARGVRIYSIGIGSEGPVPVPARLPSGRVRLQMKDYALDEALLRNVAEATDGRYFRARDAATLESVFREIDRLEEKPTEAFRAPENAHPTWMAALTAACTLGALLTLSSTFLRTAPALR